MREYVKQLQKKPEHVRRRVAYVAAGAITGIVAIVWVTALAANGTLALTSTDTADGAFGSASPANPVANTKSSVSSLLGAVGASRPPSAGTPSLNIVDVSTSSTANQSGPQANPPATEIPF